MTNKKQRADLEAALGEWIFDGIANSWSTAEILERTGLDWNKAVGTYTPASLRELTSWQAKVLDLVGLGLGWEIRADQKVKDAAVLMKAIEDVDSTSVFSALVLTVVEDVLRGTSVNRKDLALR